MKATVKHGMVFLLAGILLFYPLIAFAQEAGEVTGEEMVSESQAGSSEGGEVAVENPDPTSSPLSEAYNSRNSRCMPGPTQSKPPKSPKPH